MPSRALRVLGVLAAIWVTASAIPSRAAYYNPHFDPQFDGTVFFQIGDACLTNDPGTYASSGACVLDLISADVFALSDPGTHYTSGFQGNVGIDVVIAGNELVAMDTDPPLSCGVLCGGDLVFFSSANAELTGDTIAGTLSDGYALVRVPAPNATPEPGTLALIVGGIGIAWLTRGRRTPADRTTLGFLSAKCPNFTTGSDVHFQIQRTYRPRGSRLGTQRRMGRSK